MAEYLRMPMLGQSMEEGTILQWFKKEGDTVKRGDIVFEVMSDKANIEVEAEFEGVIRKILSPVDSTVPVKEPIAIYGTADESIDALLSGKPEQPANLTPVAAAETPGIAPVKSSAAPAAVPEDIKISPRARRAADEAGVRVADLAGTGTGPEGRIIERDVLAWVSNKPAPTRSTPLAARMAEDLGINLGDLSASTGGRIRAEDVRQAVPAQPVEELPVQSAEGLRVESIIAYRGMKKYGGETVAKSRRNAPHVTLTMEVDMTEASALLPRLRPAVEKQYGVKLTFTDLIIKAAALALGDHPLCNASLVGDEIRLYSNKNIGVAVALEAGLIVPVIKDADRKSTGAISVELKALAGRCKAGKQTTEDLSDGTFTITNLGSFGVDNFDPIIVPPQSCILGVCRIARKPVVVGDAVEIRPMMNLCLSFDHRVLDGAPASRFLLSLKELLESPLSMLV